MHELKPLIILSWVSLPTVMFGGYAALTFLRNKLSERQRTLFRLGHAHAGVLLILSLAYEYYLSLTNFSGTAKLLSGTLLAVGIIMQSGGFFWHAFLDKDGQRRGTYITSVGALFLVTAIAILVAGIVRSI